MVAARAALRRALEDALAQKIWAEECAATDAAVMEATGRSSTWAAEVKAATAALLGAEAIADKAAAAAALQELQSSSAADKAKWGAEKSAIEERCCAADERLTREGREHSWADEANAGALHATWAAYLAALHEREKALMAAMEAKEEDKKKAELSAVAEAAVEQIKEALPALVSRADPVKHSDEAAKAGASSAASGLLPWIVEQRTRIEGRLQVDARLIGSDGFW